MGVRFAHMHIALFEDGLRLARERKIRLISGHEDERHRSRSARFVAAGEHVGAVKLGGEWEDVKRLYPEAKWRPAYCLGATGVLVEQRERISSRRQRK